MIFNVLPARFVAPSNMSAGKLRNLKDNSSNSSQSLHFASSAIPSRLRFSSQWIEHWFYLRWSVLQIYEKNLASSISWKFFQHLQLLCSFRFLIIPKCYLLMAYLFIRVRALKLVFQSLFNEIFCDINFLYSFARNQWKSDLVT